LFRFIFVYPPVIFSLARITKWITEDITKWVIFSHSRNESRLNVQSHPPKLVLGQSDTRIEVPAQLRLRAILHRSADEIMDGAQGLVDALLRKRKNNIRGIEVSSDRQGEDSLGGFLSPVLEDLGRVVMLPHPILETEHLKITKIFHFALWFEGRPGSRPG
jgi:hypothetical protein